MNFRNLSLLLSACLVPLGWSTGAHAQAADIAKKLLEEAKSAKDTGEIPKACRLLDRAYELDPKEGLLFARADCRDNENKIAAAVILYEAYLRAFSRMTGPIRANHTVRAEAADARLKELTPRVPMLKFLRSDKTPDETKINVDGVEYQASMLESRLPLEPGTHVIVVVLPGEPERRRTVTLAEGGSLIVDVTPLPPETPPVPPKPPPNQPKKPKPKIGKPKGRIDSMKIGGFVGVGLGAAGVVVGSVLGGLAVAEKQDLDAHCNTAHRCDRTGLASADRIQTLGNASTAALVVSGVFAAASATLLVVAYRSPYTSTAAQLRLHTGMNAAQLEIGGTF